MEGFLGFEPRIGKLKLKMNWKCMGRLNDDDDDEEDDDDDDDDDDDGDDNNNNNNNNTYLLTYSMEQSLS